MTRTVRRSVNWSIGWLVCWSGWLLKGREVTLPCLFQSVSVRMLKINILCFGFHWITFKHCFQESLYNFSIEPLLSTLLHGYNVSGCYILLLYLRDLKMASNQILYIGDICLMDEKHSDTYKHKKCYKCFCFKPVLCTSNNYRSSLVNFYDAVLCYGGTGTGKTHSLVGPNNTTTPAINEEEFGIIPR